MRVFIFFIFLLGNCFAQDKSPLRVCYFSMNNMREFDELDKFNKRLSEKAGQKIVVKEYLTERNGSVEAAFKKLLESGETCDGIVFSGHHTGGYGGSNVSDRLTLEFLESHSCDPKYQDWFANVKALWLQGCNTVRNGEVDTIDTAQYHTFRVGRVLEEDGLEQTYADLNREYSATLDQDNPLVSRYLRAFPQASVFGWSAAAPGVGDKSEYAIPYHIAHTTKLYTDKEQYFKNPLEEMSLEVAVKYSEVFQRILGGDVDEAKRCSFEPYALDGWKDITDTKAGKVRHYAPYFQYYDPNASFAHLYQGGINDMLKKAKRYDCLFKNVTSPQKLSSELDELLKDPMVIGYTHNNLFEYLQNLKKNGNFAGYELIKKKLLENANVTNFLMKKMDSNVVGALVKIDYYKFYEELAGKNESFIKNIQNSVLDSLRVGGDQEIEAQVEYQRNLGQALIKNKLIDSSFIRSILDQKDLNTRMLGLAANILRLSQNDLEDEEVVRIALEILDNPKANQSSFREILQMIYERKTNLSGQDKILAAVLNLGDLDETNVNSLMTYIAEAQYKIENLDLIAKSYVEKYAGKINGGVLASFLASSNVFHIQKLKNYQELLSLYLDKTAQEKNFKNGVELLSKGTTYIGTDRIEEIKKYLDQFEANNKEEITQENEAFFSSYLGLFEVFIGTGLISHDYFENKLLNIAKRITPQSPPGLISRLFMYSADKKNSYERKILEIAEKNKILQPFLSHIFLRPHSFNQAPGGYPGEMPNLDNQMELLKKYSKDLSTDDFFKLLQLVNYNGVRIFDPRSFSVANSSWLKEEYKRKRKEKSLIEYRIIDPYNAIIYLVFGNEEGSKLVHELINNELSNKTVPEWVELGLDYDEFLTFNGSLENKKRYIDFYLQNKNSDDAQKREVIKNIEGRRNMSSFISDYFFHTLTLGESTLDDYLKVPAEYIDSNYFTNYLTMYLLPNNRANMIDKYVDTILKQKDSRTTALLMNSLPGHYLDDANFKKLFDYTMKNQNYESTKVLFSKISDPQSRVQERESALSTYLDSILSNRDSIANFLTMLSKMQPAPANKVELWLKALNTIDSNDINFLFTLLRIDFGFLISTNAYPQFESKIDEVFKKSSIPNILILLQVHARNNKEQVAKLAMKLIDREDMDSNGLSFLTSRDSLLHSVLKPQDIYKIISHPRFEIGSYQEASYAVNAAAYSLNLIPLNNEAKMTAMKNLVIPAYLSKQKGNKGIIHLIQQSQNDYQDDNNDLQEEIFLTLFEGLDIKELVKEGHNINTLDLRRKDLYIFKKFMTDKNLNLSPSEMYAYFGQQNRNFFRETTKEEREIWFNKFKNNNYEVSTFLGELLQNLEEADYKEVLTYLIHVDDKMAIESINRLIYRYDKLIKKFSDSNSNEFHLNLTSLFKKLALGSETRNVASLIYTWQDKINPEFIKKLDRKTSLQYLDFFNTFVSSDAYKKFTYHSRRKNRSNFYQAMKNNKRRVEELWRQPAAKTFEENIKVEQTNQ